MKNETNVQMEISYELAASRTGNSSPVCALETFENYRNRIKSKGQKLETRLRWALQISVLG